MAAHSAFSLDETADIAASLGVDLDDVGFDLEELQAGLDLERDFRARDREADPADLDPLQLAQIALGHLTERADYYSRLARMAADATDTD